MTRLYLALPGLVWLLVGCAAQVPDSAPIATEQPTVEPINLIAPESTPAAAGDAGWEYQRTATADFDGDGADEQAILIAQVGVSDGRPLWEDGHAWQLYVEESDGTRTYVYTQFVPFGLVEALVTNAAPGQSPAIMLIEHTPQRVRISEIVYSGPNQIQAREVVQRELDPRKGFSGTPN
jgi:hypothetical protein